MPSASSSRRTFLKTAAVTTAASYSRVLGANDRIRMGCIGTGPRGQYLIRELGKTGAVEWVAMCDIYDLRRDQAATIAGGPVKTYKEHERLLAHADIDAVVVATPDHWHAPITIEACQAGKDVYVEKPMVHNPRDGQAVVKAARQHKRIVQVGMQARAMPHYEEARKRHVVSGNLGKVGLARTWYDANRGYTLVPPPGMEKKPEGLDWDRWLGPGPKVPWNPNIFFSPYKWLHYDGGMIMGIGIHVIDTVHHYLGLTKTAAVVAGGGIYHYDDGRDTPDVINLILEYPEKLNVTFEAEIMTAGLRSSVAGIELRGTGGALTVHRYENLGWEFVPNPKNNKGPIEKAPGGPPEATELIKNWLDCIRTRQKPVANEEAGYYSSVACYMGVRAYQAKKRITWDDDWNL